MRIFLFTDGGAIGNPGPAGAGVVIMDEKNKILNKIFKYLGRATNNQAEFWAIILGLEWVAKNFPSGEVTCFLDSQLACRQLNLQYKVKNKELKTLFWKIRDLVMRLGGKVTFQYIEREKNKEADKLVRQAIKMMDREEKGNYV